MTEDNRENPDTSGASLPGVYIHVPFCKTKCPYCDFYSITDTSLADKWAEQISREILLYKGTYGTFDSIYIGGGTPTILEAGHLEIIFEALFSGFAFSGDTEITFEANPDDVTRDKLHDLKVLGINRISIGVQSFNEAELDFLQRRHTVSGAVDAIRLVKDEGYNNLSIDLMYGLPGQSIKDWAYSLEKAVSFAPAHLSCYQFTLEDRTPYGKLKTEGKLITATEEEEREFFLFTSDFLEHKGYIHYEISNFAHSEVFYSRHNMKYWQHIPYLGLGPAAHSFMENKRWWNTRSVDEYCRMLDKGEKPLEGMEELSQDQLRLERLFLGFRTKIGVGLNDIPDKPESKKTLLYLEEKGMVRVVEDRIIPAKMGFLFADRLPLMF